MVRFISVWIEIVVVFFILSLSWAIFSPILNNVFSDLVDQVIWENQQIPSNNDQVAADNYLHQLYVAKQLILGFFNLFPFALGCILLVYGVLSSLRREEADYYV